MARETWVQSQVESYQRLSIIRYGSRVKWSNRGKGVAPFPPPCCSSYRKGSLRVTLDYGRQHYFLLYLPLICTLWALLVWSVGFYGISTFVGHLTPFLCKEWVIFQTIQFSISMLLILLEPYQVLPLRARVDLGAMAIKGYSVFPKAPALLGPRHQIV